MGGPTRAGQEGPETDPRHARPSALAAASGGARLEAPSADRRPGSSPTGTADNSNTADVGINPDLQADGAGAADGSRGAWMRLGERVFSHPRYAVIILAALTASMLLRHPLALAALAAFFGVEIALRLRLQIARPRSALARAEWAFLSLDALATASLLASAVAPGSWLGLGVWLRLARLLRGMVMLRMLRVFRFLSLDALTWSMGLAVAGLALTAAGMLSPALAPYAGMALMLEAGCRAWAAARVVESPLRRRAEIVFAMLDIAVCLPLLGLVTASPAWAALRLARFLVMLNPLGSLASALAQVAARDAVRKEATMLGGMFALLMGLTAAAVLWIYPHMDLNDDGRADAADYSSWQVLYYGFRILLDPGNATADAFSPWLATLSMLIVLSGVFFFALFVGLGSNVMHYLLEELANSPLTPRESLLLAGANDQALNILRAFDRMCARMRRSFASAWISFGPAMPGARRLGRWLAVRETAPGARDVLRRFRLSGVRAAVLFQPRWQGDESLHELADLHALGRELARQGGAHGLTVCDSALPEAARSIHARALGMDVVDSAALKARMLYQMHHCAWMPELGALWMDTAGGETGLHACAWEAVITPDGDAARIERDEDAAALERWLAACFRSGLNILAARMEDGSHALMGDLRKVRRPTRITHVLALGGEPDLWPEWMTEAMKADPPPAMDPPLAAFTWPDKWDLKMIFIGWHDGLPAMMEEMARKHHKLAIHVLLPGDAPALALRRQRMEQAAARIAEQSPDCRLTMETHDWDGLDVSAIEPLLKGCKVVMLYPPDDAGGGEDSMLEAWFHETAHMLNERKKRVKWWTPPKLMVLPRAEEHIAALREAAAEYTHLETHVGSPDAFHDVFMARQILARIAHAREPERIRRELRAFEFMHVVLGDAIIVEDAPASRMLAREDAAWEEIYREAWRRGWMLTGYVQNGDGAPESAAFRLLNAAFPAAGAREAGRVRLLAGEELADAPPPASVAAMLFCRRGVLARDDENNEDATAKTETIAKVPPPSADNDKETAHAAETPAPAGTPPQNDAGGGTELAHPSGRADNPEAGAPAEIVREGEVMPETIWPREADKRLLRVLQRQVEESLALLGASSEGGLMKLAEAMDKAGGGEVCDDIMAALTELQNIDRVMQRLRNVESCLKDWADAAPEPQGEAAWSDEVAGRYVMEEERQVLRSEL